MKKRSVLFTATILVAVICSAIISPAIHAADTSSDPLVTLSYIEEVLAPKLKEELVTYINNNFVSAPSANVTPGDSSLPEDGENEDGAQTPDSGNESTATTLVPQGFTVVHMTKDQVLYPLSPTEIILRSGQANTISAFMDQGICDMTDGIELYNDDPLPRYHYCLIPRGDDGRGVIAVSDEIYIMVRGAYEIRE